MSRPKSRQSIILPSPPKRFPAIKDVLGDAVDEKMLAA
jgi:hypothetical protein